MSEYNVVMSTAESTVVTEYEPQQTRSDAYQSEAALENAFIKMLTEQGYQYLKIDSPSALIDNLRHQLEKLNNYNFSDKEWKQFFENKIANSNEGIIEKTRKIQEDHIQVLRRDDGSSKNIYLIDKANIHNNSLQVINQYVEEGGAHDTRYDVTILVNGLPLVHIELKRRGVPIKEAFNQIERYQRDSFWAGCGLYEYVQVFVISNGTNTKYYSNTTRNAHIKEQNGKRSNGKKTSNSFEFTSFWADGNNRVIADLVDFTKTFFAKHTILNILTKYCIFTSEQLLFVMRPYQIVATERILNRIEISTNYKQTGTIKAGGYIWHTTGSGKTLTSFKTALLASKLPYIDKVLFVVDRKDLDYQTIKEYDRFEKGAANSNKNTAILQKQLEDDTSSIIVTTIQKLDVFIQKNKGHEVYDKHIVLIFDECHRSQFGDMHTRIVKYFKNYHIFGFTGTPIFALNAGTGSHPDLRTTEQAFGDKLHTYTIVDAINDGNVLPFRIDYINTVKKKEGIKNGCGESWDMWKNIAKQAKHGEYGNPNAFCNDVEATNWMSATVQTSNEEIIKHIINVCKRDPRDGKVTTGGIVTVKDSTDNWYLSWTINRQPQFKAQDKNTVLVWLYALNTNKNGNYVKKSIRNCTGEEVCREWLYHIGIDESKIDDLAKNACNTTTCYMPYINAFFQPRKESDRPKVVPDGAVNFAFIGQFAETPRDTIFTTEYSIRTGMESVYTLLDVDRGVPEVWGSKYDVRELLRACYYAIDKKKIDKVPLTFKEKFLLKNVLKKVKGTDVELLLRESGLIK